MVSSSHPLLLTAHAANGTVEAPLKQISTMKDLLLSAHVVVNTLNLEIFTLSFGRLRQRILLKCVQHVKHD